MKLYDECIVNINSLLDTTKCHTLDYKEATWQDEGKSQLIFQSDMAYELGGGTLPAVSGIAFTNQMDLVSKDEAILIGKNLHEIDENSSFARIVFVRLKESDDTNTDALYQTLRRIEYTRYHLNPMGYMMRISAKNQREVVRIGEEALKEGLNFEKVANQFISAYHKHKEVEAVKIVFITDPSFAYDELSKVLSKSENITKALDHLAKKVTMDCNACHLKQVCAEVETMCKDEKEKRSQRQS